MGPLLGSLVNLQSIELELRRTKQKLKKNRQVVLAQDQRITQLQAALKAKQEEIKLTQLQHHKLEMDLKIRDTEIAKLRLQLNTAKTNKEYSIILTKINTDKADKSKLEEQILGFMSSIEADQKGCKDIQQKIDEETRNLDEVKRDAAEKEISIQHDFERLTQQREEAAGQVPEKERRVFERLSDRFEGEVLAEIDQNGGKRNERVCGGCFMSITLETVNALMTRDELVMCPNCGRILVLDIKPQQQPAS